MEPILSTAKTLGLSEEEFYKIRQILNREPNFTELSIFSVMWSEHCSYKSSILWLKTLPRKGERLFADAGEENAGAVDIGDDWVCVFKIESHNHPSAIEPYQGAATGVGGIHRDIFTMGARPVAALNSLRFGNLTDPKTKHLLKGVVKGIGDYGNCFGVPTIGGEIYFEDKYQANPLVNALSVGLVKKGKTVSAAAKGIGNSVYIVGSATGKDGIHGATFASDQLNENSSEELPSVQVGDPFQEKLLLEATLEVIETGGIVGMQDMGAAGIICSTSEMSARGSCGMTIDLDKVPTRQKSMQGWEILLSESQERMLLVVEKDRREAIEKIFDKWDLNCIEIGTITEGNRLQYYKNGLLEADVPADALVLGGGAPVYRLEYTKPTYLQVVNRFDITQISLPADYREIAWRLCGTPNIVSKRWIYEQYDSMVGINSVDSVKKEISDAAIIRIKDSNRALAITVDCNARYVFSNPYQGTAIAVAEAARNIVCSGGEPIAITNCLNFGNPNDREVYWQFVESVKAIGDVCRRFNTPVTGGNVSFYNQTGNEAVYPTPVIGMLGILDNVENRMTTAFKQKDSLIYLLGKSVEDINCSEYLKIVSPETLSPAPYFNLEEEILLHEAVNKLIASRKVESVHDISEGGLFIALLESAMTYSLGFNITVDKNIRKDAFLFGEAQGRAIISVAGNHREAVENMLSASGVPFRLLGKTTGGNLHIDGEDFGEIGEWAHHYDTAIEKLMGAG